MKLLNVIFLSCNFKSVKNETGENSGSWFILANLTKMSKATLFHQPLKYFKNFA